MNMKEKIVSSGDENTLAPRFDRERKINSKKLMDWIGSSISTHPKPLDKFWDQWAKLSELTDVEMSVALDDLQEFGLICLEEDDRSDTLISLSSRRVA